MIQSAACISFPPKTNAVADVAYGMVHIFFDLSVRNLRVLRPVPTASSLTDQSIFCCRLVSDILRPPHKQAQDNITLLNNLIWGTCNTNTDASQCNANMAWFAENLEDTCAEDIKANNPVVTQTREGA